MAITSMSSVKAVIDIKGTYLRTVTAYPDDFQGQLSFTRTTSYTYGTSGADTINQAVTFIFTATANTTTRLDLSGALTNVIGEGSATFTKIKWILFELLSTTQDSTNGTAASSVTIAPSASNPITTSPLGSDVNTTYTMENGDKWLCEKHNSGGITVASGSADGFGVLNNDTAVDGGMRLTVLGNS